MPVGKPTITSAQNISATAILLTWKPPPADTMNGEFLGYRISYRPYDKGNDYIRELYLRNRKLEVKYYDVYRRYNIILNIIDTRLIKCNRY